MNGQGHPSGFVPKVGSEHTVSSQWVKLLPFTHKQVSLLHNNVLL